FQARYTATATERLRILSHGVECEQAQWRQNQLHALSASTRSGDKISCTALRVPLRQTTKQKSVSANITARQQQIHQRKRQAQAQSRVDARKSKCKPRLPWR